MQPIRPPPLVRAGDAQTSDLSLLTLHPHLLLVEPLLIDRALLIESHEQARHLLF